MQIYKIYISFANIFLNLYSDNNLITTIKTIGSSTLQGIILKKGLSGLGNILENINDRNLGFVSMDENFGKEFNENPRQVREKKLSSGNANLKWVWVIYD